MIKLVKFEEIELRSIISMLTSEDEESVKLGYSLLKTSHLLKESSIINLKIKTSSWIWPEDNLSYNDCLEEDEMHYDENMKTIADAVRIGAPKSLRSTNTLILIGSLRALLSHKHFAKVKDTDTSWWIYVSLEE